MVVYKFLQDGFVAGARKVALIIKKAQKPMWPPLNECKAPDIVEEINVAPVDAFALVFLLFVFENVLIEIELQMFVGEVDTKLLEVVLIAEILESKDV